MALRDLPVIRQNNLVQGCWQSRKSKIHASTAAIPSWKRSFVLFVGKSLLMQYSHLQHRCSSLQGMELEFPRVKEVWDQRGWEAWEGSRTEPVGCRVALKPSRCHSTEQTHVGFYPSFYGIRFLVPFFPQTSSFLNSIGPL